MSQWKGRKPSILLLEGTAKTLTFQEDGVKIIFPQIRSVDLVMGKGLLRRGKPSAQAGIHSKQCYQWGILFLWISPQQQKYHYCSHKYMDQIEKSLKSGKYLVDKKLL